MIIEDEKDIEQVALDFNEEGYCGRSYNLSWTKPRDGRLA
jgi:hypothetical protein